MVEIEPILFRKIYKGHFCILGGSSISAIICYLRLLMVILRDTGVNLGISEQLLMSTHSIMVMDQYI